MEYTIDVGLRAGQDSMPAGLAKVLEILNGSLSMSDPDGKLVLNDTEFIVSGSETARLVATYMGADGLYAPEAIKLKKDNTEQENWQIVDKISKVYALGQGDYTVEAGDYIIAVKVNQKS